jgi:hypothetical protein
MHRDERKTWNICFAKLMVFKGAWKKGMVGGIVDVHNMYFNSHQCGIYKIYLDCIARAISYFKLRVYDTLMLESVQPCNVDKPKKACFKKN